MPRSLRPQFSVTPEEQGKLNKILKKFEAKEVKELTGSPQDLMYALKLIEHYKNIEETGGHLVKLFQPETPLSIEHYPAHKAFFDATAEYQQVLFRASNQTGKTTSGAYAISCWSTGDYPDWWQGRVFDKAPVVWACGDTNDTVREILQSKFLGTPKGTGLIAEKNIYDIVIRPNTGGTVDSIWVRHANSKLSQIKFKTYQSGPESFYGKPVDIVWLDEEPAGKDAPLIWNQAYIRLTTTNGTFIVTFTPLLGWTALLKDFTEKAVDVTPKKKELYEHD